MADSFSSAPSALGEGFVKPSKYRTVPDQESTTMPKGVPYIIGNEFAERFSFYGMRSILVVFMTGYLLNRNGQLDVMNETEARGWYHAFAGWVYFTPILGGILADAILGRYLTILLLSVVYCFGHFALAVDDTRLGLLIGLGLITLGAGGIKSSVSANVGDQFGTGNKHLLPNVYGWFYFSINAGSAIATTLCPILLNDKRFGSHYAFGLPGIFMLIATIVFWMGRKEFVHIQPAGLKAWVQETFSREGLAAIGRLLIVYAFVCVFWALFDQSGGEWTLQAKKLDLNVCFWRNYLAGAGARSGYDPDLDLRSFIQLFPLSSSQPVLSVDSRPENGHRLFSHRCLFRCDLVVTNPHRSWRETDRLVAIFRLSLFDRRRSHGLGNRS
jgi:dipeptide/tripeptide permease